MKYLLFITLICSSAVLSAQGTLLTPGHPAHHIMDRWAIKGLTDTSLHAEIQPYWRQDVHLRAGVPVEALTPGDLWDLQYVKADNNFQMGVYPESSTDTATPGDTSVIWVTGEPAEITAGKPYYQLSKPLLKYFYRSPAYLFEIDRPFFSFRVNPILNARIGQDPESPDLVFTNQRGLELQGSVDNKIFFFTNLLETQSFFPKYVDDRVQGANAIPGVGLYKYPRTSRIFGTENAYDYLISEGYVGFNVTRHVGVQLGHGRNFIGNGYRSLLLSDFGANYFFLKLNWRVWKFHFQNIFTELSLRSGRDDKGDRLVPKKYMAAHYLSFKPTDNLSFGFFEAVVFSRSDQFEFQYLNPIILYRTVEQFLGSPDNVLIGLNASWNLFERVQLYGQVMLDEFKFDELFLNNRKWWGNKYGIQGGIKYIDAFGIDHLDLQAEVNLVRPYTYTHRDSTANYTHYNQPLAHPNGANFREALFRFRYRPFPKWELLGRVIYNEFGDDTETENWGSNIITPNILNRQVEEGSVIGQGVPGESLLAGIELRYYFWHNMSVEVEYLYRKKTSVVPEFNQNTNYFGVGLRMNVPRRYDDY
jgi:hypothetical protein